jgi:hypothetical protein
MKSNQSNFLKIKVTKTTPLFLVIEKDLKVITLKRLVLNKILKIINKLKLGIILF